ncbi:hypothetical protein [Kocuria oceani]|uniref:Gram-positive cocci surface proteins LPxTG domain-containing protein n=1 Tax=Kocuria oceani TaxID=988827 RepID=A0ABV9TJM4_9MICC|nr:hypothetical protein [Kocuria oceani]
MILPVFEPALPVLLAATGSILAVAGLLIIAGRRRRGFVAVGACVLVAGVAIISPSTTSHTARATVTATSEAITGLTGRADPGPDPADGEIVAVETRAAP